MTERKRYFLRYNGGLMYFEVAGPAACKTIAAAQRLGLSESGDGLLGAAHQRNERHGRWMLDDVALPLAEQYPE